MNRLLILGTALVLLPLSLGGCPTAMPAPQERNNRAVAADPCSAQMALETEQGVNDNLSEAVEDDPACPDYDASRDPELTLAVPELDDNKGGLAASARSGWATVPGSQQPIIRRRTDDGRLFKYYASEAVNNQTGERGVVVSVWRSNRRSWERRIFTAAEINELGPGGVALRGPALRFSLGGIFGGIVGGVQGLINEVRGLYDDIKDLVTEFREFLDAVVDTFTRFGKALLAAAKELDPNSAGRFAKAISEVQSAPSPLHVKMQYVIDRTTALDPSGRTTRVMGLAILRAK